MIFKLSLVETRRGCAMLETTPRYDVLVNGQVRGQLTFNMRGYIGSLPLPDGRNLSMPEGGITTFKREAARINREAAALRATAEA